MSRIGYLLWASSNRIGASTSCPSCNSPSRLVRRKYLVTALHQCTRCSLRFRVPKDKPEAATAFYEDEVYKQSSTTSPPHDDELKVLLETRFAGTDLDYARRIDILRALGLPPGARILDFGCSWGYGSWQMTQAGFDVSSCEIGAERRRYAQEKLGVTLVDDLRQLDGSMDCFFSSHVIEHLPDPTLLFDEAQKTLKPGGLFVCFCPNGAVQRERREPDNYDKNWGMVHPLMMTPEFMKHKANEHGFEKCQAWADVMPEQINSPADQQLEGGELLAFAWKRSAPAD